MAFGRRGFLNSPMWKTGSPETEEDTTVYAPGMIGGLAEYTIPGTQNVAVYRLVKQAAAVSGIVGTVFCWSNRTIWEVTNDHTNVGRPAGVGQKVVATAATYIWIAVRGNRPVVFQGSPTTAPAVTGVQAVVSATTGVANGVTTASVVGHLGATTSAAASNVASVDLAILDAY